MQVHGSFETHELQDVKARVVNKENDRSSSASEQHDEGVVESRLVLCVLLDERWLDTHEYPQCQKKGPQCRVQGIREFEGHYFFLELLLPRPREVRFVASACASLNVHEHATPHVSCCAVFMRACTHLVT